MSEMIERVAKAIYEEDDPWHKAWPWPDLNEKQGTADAYRRIAAAAIKAMREPTFPMVKAMFNTKDDGGGSLHERKWQSAIDAALVGEVG
ncbi:hypothetical protein N6H05_14935 [Sphingobium sp. WTD-1]|uniref:hypothetical protein n=1 Tax=Sphingobium sp. WTD-1 TaxID=2979467 RepID=UPI0024DE369B|nr:hypothetical protein [Sphingobium sp. WTD-1]WIA54360.1 hypothetical protein N6H05_14935 [Sphingobium sp. WTD-1]